MIPRTPSVTEEKLLLLYSLDQLGPLTREQLLRFFVEHDLMNYITMQLALAELEEAQLIRPKDHPLGTLHQLSQEGLQILRLFRKRLPASRALCVDDAVETWRARFAREQHILADSSPLPDGEYAVHLQILEEGLSLMSLTLRLPSQEQAEAFRKAFHSKAGPIYAAVMRSLGTGSDGETAGAPPQTPPGK